MKPVKACTQCRDAKRKCTIADGDTICQPCKLRKQQCALPQRPLNTIHRNLLPEPANSRSNIPHNFGIKGLDYRVRNELVDLYLRLIHDKPHTLFHPATLKLQVRQGIVSKPILYAILSLAARFHGAEEVQQQTQAFAYSAKEALKSAIDIVSLENSQACVLVGNICGAEGDGMAECLYFGIAFRMAHIIRLPEHAPDEGPIQREVKRRTWWSLYMIDQWSSVGLGLPRQIQDSKVCPLPMPESDFHRMEPNRPNTDEDSGQLGLWAYMIILAKIFSKIQDLIFRSASGELDMQQLEIPTLRLAEELDNFIDALPSDTRLNVENLEHHSTNGLGPAFVALHLGYHHYGTLLYFQYLDLQLERTVLHKLFAQKCKRHATSFSDLLQLSKDIGNCKAVYFIVTHMTVVSSASLLHTLFFGDDNELPKTRQRLQANFETLIKLRSYWPAVGMMTACMQSTNPNTHKVDRWMVKFLLEHALPIQDRDYMDHTNRMSERGRYASDALSMLRAPAG